MHIPIENPMNKLIDHLARALARGLVGLFLLSGCVSSATALEASINGYINLGYESNANREELSANQQSDGTQAVGLVLNVSEQRSAFDIDADYDIDYINYRRSPAGGAVAGNQNESRATGSSNLNVSLIPRRLDWEFEHDIERILAQRDRINRSNNQETRNTFYTGPTLTLPLTAKISSQTQLGVTRTSFDRAENSAIEDSRDPGQERYIAQHSFFYQQNRLNRFGLGGSFSRTNRDDSNIDQDVATYYLSFNRQLRNLGYSARIGFNELDFGNSSNSGEFFSLNLDFRTGGGIALFSASRQIGFNGARLELGSGLASDGFLGTGTSSNDLNLNNALEITTVDTNFSTSLLCSQCRFDFELSYEKNVVLESLAFDTFTVNNQRDDEVLATGITLKYTISRKQDISLRARWSTINVEDIANINNDFDRTGLSLTWNLELNRRSSINFSSGWADRQNKSATATNREFEELTATIGYRYNFFRR